MRDKQKDRRIKKTNTSKAPERLTFHDMRDLAEVAEVYSLELQRAVKSDKINPHWIRAIYSGLRKKRDEYRGKDILGHFNAGHHRKPKEPKKPTLEDLKIHFIEKPKPKGKAIYFTESTLNPTVCYFVDFRITNWAKATLSKKYVLLQLLNDSPKKNEFVISWGEVLDFEGDQTKEWLVKILNKERFAEEFHGKSIWVKDYEILRVASEPVPLINKKGNWKY